MLRRGISASAFALFGLLVVIFAGLWFLYTSENFERKKPVIAINDTIYWNLRSPVQINIQDDSGVKFVRVSMSDGQNEINMLNQILETPLKNFDLNLTFPKTGFFSNKKDSYDMNIEVVDISKWNFFSGNKEKKNVKVIVDTTKPDLYILSNSYAITKGGSAVVVFKVADNDLKEVYVQTDYGKKFAVTPFYKDGYYAALVVWPAARENFRAEVVARDSAGNENRSYIRYFLQNFKYKSSTIELRDNFIDGKVTELTELYAKDPQSLGRLEKMRFINETLRDSNEQSIAAVTSKIPTDQISNFSLQTFYPLRNGKKVADFADHRFYTYNGEQISESWHMGIDFASVAQAPIVSSNDGEVVFAQENGIYGQNIVIDHGFGLYSLYAHCSSMSVKVGDRVTSGQQIGTTGISGLALGDHLHFGIIVQGEEVRPQQWMDKKWIKDNVTSVLDAAKAMIDKN
ncbi:MULTISPECIES: M23 family metallopeptidase [unclassified Campylobacter]|uniref:M23 family metallopeptidase n=1 Tax=unclassified Campylobacter TaxID=2593542 RepID=UPI003D34B1B5